MAGRPSGSRGHSPAHTLSKDVVISVGTIALAEQSKVVAIGEAGLDFFRNRAPRAAQAEAFRRQIRLARELDLPLIVHDRDAHQETMQLLKEEAAQTVLLHCFSGDLALAEEARRRGYYLSIAGPVTYPKNETLREIVRKAKTERLLLETDCPYLPPQPVRGQRNEPAHLLHTACEVARLLDMPLTELGRLTTENACDFCEHIRHVFARDSKSAARFLMPRQ